MSNNIQYVFNYHLLSLSTCTFTFLVLGDVGLQGSDKMLLTYHGRGA